ncbi:MAG: slipin family protein [Myxococcales bacterium]|nr:slipin family protein [Myxococcales bacterium]
MTLGLPIGVVVTIAVVLVYFAYAMRIVTEFERGVMFFFGRFVGVKQPGLRLVFPPFFRMIKVDLRTIVADVPPQDVITKDNVSASVNAVIYFRVVHPDKAVLQVNDYLYATSQLAQTTLRSVLGSVELDELLSEREKINDQLQALIDQQTDPWGIKVSSVEVKHVELPDAMKRVMARQAEAERERRAKVIAADGEFQASRQLSEAARVLGSQPGSLQLRYLQTVVEVAASNNSTTLFPLPLELMDALKRIAGPDSGEGS